MGPCVPGTCALPLVNTEGEVVPLPLGETDHACDMSGLGGAQSLFAVGSHSWMGGEREFLTVLTELKGELQSATINNTATTSTLSNMFPLPMGPSNTPMLLPAGVECNQASSATCETMITVALNILRCVDLTGRWKHFENDTVKSAANAALSIQAAEQQAQLQAAANATSRMGSDCTSDSDSGSDTPPEFMSLEPSDEEQPDHDDAAASESEGASTAELSAALLAQHTVAADQARQRQTTATRKAKGAAPLKEATQATKCASKQRPNHFAGSVHALAHSTAKQAAATVQLDQQVQFHDGPPSSSGKRIDMSRTTVTDFEVLHCSVCMHTKTVGPSRSKGLANAAAATSNST